MKDRREDNLTKCCNTVFIPAFFDYKCPECGKEVKMSKEEKAEAEYIKHVTTNFVKRLNEHD